jgi:hypothetical protein
MITRYGVAVAPFITAPPRHNIDFVAQGSSGGAYYPNDAEKPLSDADPWPSWPMPTDGPRRFGTALHSLKYARPDSAASAASREYALGDAIHQTPWDQIKYTGLTGAAAGELIGIVKKTQSPEIYYIWRRTEEELRLNEIVWGSSGADALMFYDPNRNVPFNPEVARIRNGNDIVDDPTRLMAPYDRDRKILAVGEVTTAHQTGEQINSCPESFASGYSTEKRWLRDWDYKPTLYMRGTKFDPL